jgi:hypothetical protein
MRFPLVLILGALSAVVAAPFAEAKPRPTVSTVGDCFNDPDVQYDCDGTLCSCCYDDGCWICNAGTPSDCEWEGKYFQPGKSSSGKRPEISPGKPKLSDPELLLERKISPQ